MNDLPKIHVLRINIEKRLAVAEEGIGDIVNFVDDDGEETDEPATYAIVQWRFGGWSNLDTTEYEKGHVN